ncbi:hypothetical protein BDR06DRAFT_973258 [Suillus hirtellus]|nr:hypothetical protein BDR06DRAFT_973258 [Suillus hirtellus]
MVEVRGRVRIYNDLKDVLNGKPSEIQRDLYIKSYLRDPAVLRGVHLPLVLSTFCIRRLAANSQAWDLFVRLTSAIGPPDEHVPPLPSFADVELPHACLVEQGNSKEVGFLKWACKAYEGALGTRKEAVLGARVPVGEDV